jgi:hypothetical protein
MTPSVIRANAPSPWTVSKKFSPQQIRVSLRPRRAPEHLCVGKLKRFGQILAHLVSVEALRHPVKKVFLSNGAAQSPCDTRSRQNQTHPACRCSPASTGFWDSPLDTGAPGAIFDVKSQDNPLSSGPFPRHLLIHTRRIPVARAMLNIPA